MGIRGGRGGIRVVIVYSDKGTTVCVRSDAAATIFFTAWFCAATIRGQRLFLWKAQRHQRQLDKVCTSETVTVINAVSSMHSLSVLLSVLQHSPRASPVTVVRNYLCTCPHIIAAATIQGWCLFHSELLISRLLFEGGSIQYVCM